MKKLMTLVLALGALSGVQAINPTPAAAYASLDYYGDRATCCPCYRPARPRFISYCRARYYRSCWGW